MESTSLRLSNPLGLQHPCAQDLDPVSILAPIPGATLPPRLHRGPRAADRVLNAADRARRLPVQSGLGSLDAAARRGTMSGPHDRGARQCGCQHLYRGGHLGHSASNPRQAQTFAATEGRSHRAVELGRNVSTPNSTSAPLYDA